MLDPVFAEPTQYGAPFHDALYQAVLAAEGSPLARDERLPRAIKGPDIRTDGVVDHIVDLPFGCGNRRGLCGLLCMDMAHESKGVHYHLASRLEGVFA